MGRDDPFIKSDAAMTSLDPDSERPRHPTPELSWTGERYIPGVGGEVELEHLHRYALARELAPGKSVLDIACGEGYGSDLLAAVASQVIGVDLSEEAIAHARGKYQHPNLEFRLGSCARIPVGDASIDFVVSFETLEHHDRHDEMMNEVKRVLRPDGVLIISSPDRHHYSDVPGYRNPYHVKELYLHELRALLGRFFHRVRLYGQGVRFASVVGPCDDERAFGSFMTFHHEGGGEPVAKHGMDKATYLIALASDGPLCDLPAGVFAGQDERMVALQAQALSLQAAVEAAQASRTEEQTRAASLHRELETARASLHERHERESRLRTRIETAERDLATNRSAQEEVRLECDRALGRIAAMESTKAWKLRRVWFGLRRVAGVPGRE